MIAPSSKGPMPDQTPLTVKAAILDDLADALFKQHVQWVHGIDLRRSLRVGDRQTRQAAILVLVPALLRVDGAAPGESYSLTPIGALECKHSSSILALARNLRAFVVARHAADSEFSRFTWTDIQKQVLWDGRALAEDDFEVVSFVLLCLGAWGGSGSLSPNQGRVFEWMRPLAQQLEDILEIDDVREIFRRVHDHLVRQHQLVDEWERRLATANEIRERSEFRLLRSLERHIDPQVQVAEIQAAVERYKIDSTKEIEMFKLQNAVLVERVRSETAKAVAAETRVAEVQAQAQRDVAAIAAKAESIKARYALLGALAAGLLALLVRFAMSNQGPMLP